MVLSSFTRITMILIPGPFRFQKDTKIVRKKKKEMYEKINVTDSRVK